MSEQRFSGWYVLGAVALVLGLTAAALTAGVFLGFQWGRASGRAGILAGRDRAAPPARLLPPFGPESRAVDPAEQPYLGVEFATITPELAEAEQLAAQEGALIRSVAADGPAGRAGLKVGDIVQKVDGQAVTAERTLRALVLAHQPGDQVVLTVLRSEETLELEVTLGVRALPLPFSFPEGEFPPGFRFEFRCSPEPCPFLPSQN